MCAVALPTYDDVVSALSAGTITSRVMNDRDRAMSAAPIWTSAPSLLW